VKEHKVKNKLNPYIGYGYGIINDYNIGYGNGIISDYNLNSLFPTWYARLRSAPPQLNMPKTAKFGVNPPKKQTEIFRTEKVNIVVSY
jgi:hypothetical protein